jgi:hypothetical protein
VFCGSLTLKNAKSLYLTYVTNTTAMKTVIYLLLIALPLFAFLQDGWIAVTKAKDGDEYFIKDTYVSKSEGEIKLWLRVQQPTATIKGKRYKNVKQLSLVIFDCENRRLQYTSLIQYSSTGEVLQRIQLEEYERKWVDVVPDTISEQLLDKVCQTFKD